MLKRFYIVLIISATICLSASASQYRKSQLSDKPSDEIIFTDVTGDGKPDILERWWNGKRCRWFDGNGDMTENDKLGDIVSDTLQIDMNGDGYYDGPEDMNVKWVDNTGDGKADMQIIVINAREGDEMKWAGLSHYMVFFDTDLDNVMAYMDWDNFHFACWAHTGRCNFMPDYNGNSVFLKTHMMPKALSDARLNWENPFAFYDMTGDGLTNMAVRYLDNPPSNGKIDIVQIGFDIDASASVGNEMDYDMSLEFADSKYNYEHFVHSFPAMKAADWQLKYFQHTEWLVIDELKFVPHEKAYDVAFQIDWSRCLFVFDEDNDDNRWERVELYYPNDPYAVRTSNSYEQPRFGRDRPITSHPQSDTLGDRGEFDSDNSGKGKLYISKWDRRLHLYGAEWGVWLLDREAEYFGAAATPRGSSDKMAEKVEEVVLYYDTDGNGFIDLVEFDYNGDRVPDLTINLLDYGTDVYELHDPAELGWEGLHKLFKENAAASWDEAYELYRAFWRTGLSKKSIDDLAFASSTWDMYYNGWRLKEAIYRSLLNNLKSNPDAVKQLHRYYFGGDFEGMAEWILGLKLVDTTKSEFTFTLTNPLPISRKDELVSISLDKLQGLNIDSFAVLKDGKQLPAQLDDIDFDGVADAVVFLVDMKANDSFNILITDKVAPAKFPNRAHAEISIGSSMPEAVGSGVFVDGGAFKSKTTLVRNSANKSSAYRFEGPLIESDKVGYRLYWDSRGAIDVYGKTSEAFVGAAHKSSENHHTMQPWGRDVLHNGHALGCGGLGIGTGDDRFSPGRAKAARIIVGSNGAVKASYRMVYSGFEYKGKEYELCWDISMTAGQRYMKHNITVSGGKKLPMMAALTNHTRAHNLDEMHNLSINSAANMFATFGDQAFTDQDPEKAKKSDELMGMALIWARQDAKQARAEDLEYRAIFKPTDIVSYYSLCAYNKEFGGEAILSSEQFNDYLGELCEKLFNPVIVK